MRGSCFPCLRARNGTPLLAVVDPCGYYRVGPIQTTCDRVGSGDMTHARGTNARRTFHHVRAGTKSRTKTGRCNARERRRSGSEETGRGLDTQVGGGSNDGGNGRGKGPILGHGGNGEDPDGDLPKSMAAEDKGRTSWNAIVEASKRGTTKRPFRRALQLGTARVEKMLLQHPLRASVASAATCEMLLASSVGKGGGGSSKPPTAFENEPPEDRNRPASATNRHASTRAAYFPSTATSSPFDALPKVWGEDGPVVRIRTAPETEWKRRIAHFAVGAALIGPCLLAWNRWMEEAFPGPFPKQQLRRVVAEILVGTPARECLFWAKEGCTDILLGGEGQKAQGNPFRMHFSWSGTMQILAWGGAQYFQPHWRVPIFCLARCCGMGLKNCYRGYHME